jgi:4-oxalocrotonate tautomerase family enzyme
MPIVQCDIRNGRTKEQKSALAQGLTAIVQKYTGCSIDYVFLVIREMPEHVPDYVPGPDGEDVAGGEQLRQRAANRQSA